MFQQHASTENDNENYFTTYEIMRMRTRMRFYFTKNTMKVLHLRDRCHTVLPVHTKTMKTTENAFNLLLRMCRRRYLNL